MDTNLLECALFIPGGAFFIPKGCLIHPHPALIIRKVGLNWSLGMNRSLYLNKDVHSPAVNNSVLKHFAGPRMAARRQQKVFYILFMQIRVRHLSPKQRSHGLVRANRPRLTGSLLLALLQKEDVVQRDGALD